VNDYNNSSNRTKTQQQKPIFISRVPRVFKKTGIRIIKYALRFFEPDTVLSAIAFVLGFVPLEAQQI
jgi:hypothetical protein